MKIITDPKVTVVAHSQFVEHPEYKIPPDGDDSTRLCSFAAKGCYDSFSAEGRANSENQEAILEHKHGSVLEHSYVSVFIEGVTRALTLELNRHRTLGISQRSTRYTKEEDSSIVLEPYYSELFKKGNWERRIIDMIGTPLWVNRNSLNEANTYPPITIEDKLLCYFLQSCENAIHDYKTQVEYLEKLNPLQLKGFELRKWARGKARNALPHALETRATYTANLRAWRWIIEARSNRHAESEIRRLVDLLLTELRKIAPLYFNDFEQTGMFENIPEWTPKYRKV